MQGLKWFGNVASIAGSFAVSMKFYLLGYCLFMAGASAWFIVGFVNRDKPLMVLNGFFTTANVLGLYNVLV